MREGKFDNLSGAGQPIDLEPAPAEENARLMWWALRILRQNDVIPDEVRLRKQLDHLHVELAGTTRDAELSGIVARINMLVYKINTMGTNALKSPVAPVSLERERERLRLRLLSQQPG